MNVTRVLKIAIHLALVFVAFIAAYEMRRALPMSWWLSNPLAGQVLTWGFLYTAVAAAVEAFLRTERASWRFASVREVVRLAAGAALTSAVFLVVMFVVSRAFAFPRSTLVLSAVLSLMLLVGVRIAWRLRWNPSLAFGLAFPSDSADALWVVGSTARAEAYVRSWEAGADRAHRPTSIFTPETRAVGQIIRGVPVMGAIRALLRTPAMGGPAADILFLDEPTLALGLTTAEIGELRGRGHRLLRQPSAVELGDTRAGGLREIKLEEFLPRPPLSLDTRPVGRLVAGKRVLVTGAGGSIGSEIARQLVRFGCRHIALLDHSEFSLFEIDRELARLSAGASRRAHLCNIRDEARLAEVFAEEKPQIVFHAAALKHVTLVEDNPAEGVLTNVVGTFAVARAAEAASVEDMILVSTDKAVDPSCVMGATKRIAEAILEAETGGAMRRTVVRFGNVLGSAGSVVPIFRDQIERGGPVTVTHPDVRRFFMTIPEATQLVLQATALRHADQPGSPLRKFVLEMGEPVRILDLARQMVELSAPRDGAKPRIEIVGLRPGEKMEECLLDDGESARPCAAGVSEILADPSSRPALRQDVESLRAAAVCGDPTAVRGAVFGLLDVVRGVRARPSPMLQVVGG